jgi:hypothetical protein
MQIEQAPCQADFNIQAIELERDIVGRGFADDCPRTIIAMMPDSRTVERPHAMREICFHVEASASLRGLIRETGGSP